MADRARYHVDASVEHVERAIPLLLAENEAFRLNRLANGDPARWEVLTTGPAASTLARIALAPKQSEFCSLTLIPAQSAPEDLYGAFAELFRKALVRYGFQLHRETDNETPDLASADEMRARIEHANSTDENETTTESSAENNDTEEPAPPAAGSDTPLPPLPLPTGTSTSEALSANLVELRRRIYRERALDAGAPPESRLHAARVLATSDDTETAAQALAGLSRLPDAPPEVASAAFDALTGLGQKGLPGLWELDATETDPQRLIAIAAHLAALGDTETARLRLEVLSTTDDSNIRREAITVLIDRGLLPQPQLETLALSASSEASLRLAATRRLAQEPAARPTAIDALRELAAIDDAEIAAEATGELAGIDDDDARRALVPLAKNSAQPAVRLIAARTLLRAGARNIARRALLELAASDAEPEAEEAFTILQTIATTAERDAEQLARKAALPAVQRQAAQTLLQADSPPVVQQLAADTLLRLGEMEEAVPVLLRLLRQSENDSRLRRWVLTQIDGMGDAGREALIDALHDEDDPSQSVMLAQAALDIVEEPATRRQVAAWLLAHQQPQWAIEVLTDLACGDTTPDDDARAATMMLNRALEYDARTAIESLKRILHETPHSAARSEARQILLRRQPGSLSLNVLVDALIIEEQVPETLEPALQQLQQNDAEAAQEIATRIVDRSTSSAQRWRLFNLLTELPEEPATHALKQVVARAPTAAIAFAGAEQLLTLGERRAATAVLTNLATSARNTNVRRRALYNLRDDQRLVEFIAQRTKYPDTRAEARSLLPRSEPEMWLDRAWLIVEEWAERFGLIEHNQRNT